MPVPTKAGIHPQIRHSATQMNGFTPSRERQIMQRRPPIQRIDYITITPPTKVLICRLTKHKTIIGHPSKECFEKTGNITTRQK
jgi:hypothetical protein